MGSESSQNNLVSFMDIEPSFIGGASLPELILLVKQMAIVNLAAGVFFAVLVGAFHFLIIVFFLLVGTFFGVFVTTKWLKGHKRGKPPGYFLQWAFIKLSYYGLMKRRFVEHVGSWY